MKSLINKASFRYFLMILLSTATISLTHAQDSNVSTRSTTSTTTTEETIWYSQPWAWVVGGIIVLMLIIALARRGSSSQKVTTTKTKISTD